MMNTQALVLMILTQGLVICTTGFLLYKVVFGINGKAHLEKKARLEEEKEEME
ncbi:MULTISPECIES: hypothetical protein [Rhodonellum]|nr:MULTISPECIES: hypothetical protein [Rhodonellum]MDO9552953.1 hypothetical protein [Rhodonellum sp.]SDZ25039.1 hypothetical protein SAMN05444412_108117 [Rhodonellum ikkaensis]